MRTTLTLEEDVAKELARIVETERISFKEVVNDVLRAGIVARDADARRRRARYKTRPVSIGRCLVPGIDDISDVLEFLDRDAASR